MITTVVGSFETFAQAHEAAGDLARAGYDPGQIGVEHGDDHIDPDGFRRGETRVTVVADDEQLAGRATAIFQRAGATGVTERRATWAEATAPTGGNVETSAVSTLPESSLTADRPVGRY